MLFEHAWRELRRHPGRTLLALAGVAAETGVVMLVYLDGAYRRRAVERGPSLSDADVQQLAAAEQRIDLL